MEEYELILERGERGEREREWRREGRVRERVVKVEEERESACVMWSIFLSQFGAKQGFAEKKS